MRKGMTFVWDQVCQDTFNVIKHYLTTPPVLVPPTQGKPFFLYVRSMEHSLGALLAQKVAKVTNKPSITLVDHGWSGTSLQPGRKGMSCPSVRCPEDAALFNGADYLRRIKNQSSSTSPDQAFRPQRSTHQVGLAIVAI